MTGVNCVCTYTLALISDLNWFRPAGDFAIELRVTYSLGV